VFRVVGVREVIIMGVRRESLMWAGRDVMPFSKRTYEKGLLSANSGHLKEPFPGK
jgi:hypothetical protein